MTLAPGPAGVPGLAGTVVTRSAVGANTTWPRVSLPVPRFPGVPGVSRRRPGRTPAELVGVRVELVGVGVPEGDEVGVELLDVLAGDVGGVVTGGEVAVDGAVPVQQDHGFPVDPVEDLAPFDDLAGGGQCGEDAAGLVDDVELAA